LLCAVAVQRNLVAGKLLLLPAFSPWNRGDTSTSEYRWQDGQLTLIELNVYGKPPEHIRARFDAQGELGIFAPDTHRALVVGVAAGGERRKRRIVAAGSEQ
jgi:hypothetical protein